VWWCGHSLYRGSGDTGQESTKKGGRSVSDSFSGSVLSHSRGNALARCSGRFVFCLLEARFDLLLFGFDEPSIDECAAVRVSNGDGVDGRS